MADFTALKTAIQTYIKQNGNEEITGDILQEILLSVVTTLGDGAINDLITALGNEVTARQQADGTLQQNITNEATARGNADTALQGLINGVKNNVDNGYVYAGIATPSTTPVTGKVFYLALTAGTYTNFGSTEVSQGINILKYNGSAWSLDAFIGIDDTPTPNSPKLVKSGGTFESVMTNGSAFDISAHFASGGTLATYADLSAALTALNTLSADYKRGGMSIKFVQSSDNKYVQAMCMAQNFTTDVTQWQGVDGTPTAESHNIVESGGVWKLANRSLGFSRDLCDEIKANRQQGLIKQDGTVESAAPDYSISDYISCNDDNIIKFSTYSYSSATGFCTLHFYDDNKNPLHCGTRLLVSEDGGVHQLTMIAPIPKGAVYFRINQKNSFLDSTFCYTYKGDNTELFEEFKQYTSGVYNENGFNVAFDLNYTVSPVIHLNKDDVLFVKTSNPAGTLNAFNVISSIDLGTGTITRIIGAKIGINEYQYEAENSIDVVLNVYFDTNTYISIERNRNAATVLDDGLKFTPSKIIKDIMNVRDYSQLVKNNLTDHSLIRIDGFIDILSPGYVLTDYLECKEGDVIRFSTYTYTSFVPYCSILFFDNSKNSLRCGSKLIISDSIQQIEQTISVPNGAAYFRISNRAEFVDTSYCYIYKNTSLNTETDFSIYPKGFYVDNEFVIPDFNYITSPIIRLKKGDVAFVKTSSPYDTFNVISEIDLETLSVSSLVSSIYGTNEYEYEAVDDINIVIGVFLDANTYISIERNRNAATVLDDSMKFTPSKVVKEKTDELTRAIAGISINGDSYYDMYLNGGISQLDLENVASYIGWINNGTGKWDSINTFSHTRFRVSPCSTVTIDAQNNKPAYYALLKSYPKTDKLEGTVDFAYGQSGYNTINAGVSAEITIPFNCYCLVLCENTPDYSDMLPSGLIIENFGVNNLPDNSPINSIEAEVVQLMAHKNTPVFHKGILYDIYMQDDTEMEEDATKYNSETIRLAERAVNDIDNYVAKTVFKANTKYLNLQTGGWVSPRHPNLVLDSNNDLLYCFASIIESGGAEYVATSETMAFRKFHIKEKSFDYNVTKCKIGANDFTIASLINSYNEISGSSLPVWGRDMNGSGKMIRASNGYFYWGIGLWASGFKGLILKSPDLINWSVETYFPLTQEQITTNWVWEIALEISEGVLIAAARIENVGVRMAKYNLSSRTWGSIASTQMIAARPYIFKYNSEFYLIGNINGSVTTPDYGTVVRATCAIYKINSDLSLTLKDTIVIAEGCHYAEAIKVFEKVYLLYTTDTKRLSAYHDQSDIGIKDITSIFS